MGIVKNTATRLRLPRYARLRDGVIIVNCDRAYPHWLERLAEHGADPSNPDQFWLEVARRCIANDIRDRVGGPVHVRLTGAKEHWRLADLPEGAGAESGARQFQLYYDKLKAA